MEDFFGLAWHASFDTAEGEWLEVDVPFADLKPVLRADVVDENTADFRAFRKDRVKSLQLMLSKFELGDGRAQPDVRLRAARAGSAAHPRVQERGRPARGDDARCAQGGAGRGGWGRGIDERIRREVNKTSERRSDVETDETDPKVQPRVFFVVKKRRYYRSGYLAS